MCKFELTYEAALHWIGPLVLLGELKQLLDETNCLDPFQDSFLPGYGLETNSEWPEVGPRPGECVPVDLQTLSSIQLPPLGCFSVLNYWDWDGLVVL